MPFSKRVAFSFKTLSPFELMEINGFANKKMVNEDNSLTKICQEQKLNLVLLWNLLTLVFKITYKPCDKFRKDIIFVLIGESFSV